MKFNSVSENLHTWDHVYAWPEDGDEWKGQALTCGVAYEDWKRALVERLIVPYQREGAATLEIAPGHGRWTGYLAERAGRLILVELSPSCLEYCRRHYAGRPKMEFYLTDGSSLPAGLDGQLDLIWSFDSFVHIAPQEIASYLRDFRRVLKPGGAAVIHHANRFHYTLWLAGMRKWGTAWTYLYRTLSIGMQECVDGWRSPVSRQLFARLARESGLDILEQFQRWGAGGRYGVPRHNDLITVMRRPTGSDPKA
jgi:ubiquinone/menaquinone biosynthesis C-methylase UbiE